MPPPPFDPAADTEDALMARYAESGDSATFEELFHRLAPRMLGYFRRHLSDEAAAADLLQQTFLHLHRARRDFRPGSPILPWLYTIAGNVRREHFRRLGRRPELSFDADHHPEPTTAPSSSSPTDRLVKRALLALAEIDREVLVLAWYEGLDYPEIARVLGISHGAVKVRAHRASKRLKALLEQGM